MTTPNLPERRENAEPDEGAEPVPPALWVVYVGLVIWGFAYFLLYTGDPVERGGDMRSDPSVAAAAEAGATAAAAPAAPDGAALYASRCASCHQANGQGLPGAFPPLAGSPWPTGPVEVPIQIVLGGLSGPIEVNGTTYQGVMPAFASQLNDAEIAAVLTHVRGAWGNSAGPIDAAQVAATRAGSAGRAGPWTAAELRP